MSPGQRPRARRSGRRDRRPAAPARRRSRASLDPCGEGRVGWEGALAVGGQLADPAPHALAGLRELVLKLRQLGGAVADERQLAVDVAAGLLEQLATAGGGGALPVWL